MAMAEFGKEDGKDYVVEDLHETPAIEDYYDMPEDESSANQTGDPQGQYPPAVRLLYFYHPDYLGNVEYITDMDGLPYQYFSYTPWGEEFKSDIVPQNSWDSPYRFNGKELDDETGLYYYGARYYNPSVSTWLSVDAMATGYPHLTPYNFVENNPIMLIDPDGNSPIYGLDGSLLGTDDQGLMGEPLFMESDLFTQGMSHDVAVSNNVGVNGMNYNDDGSSNSLSDAHAAYDNFEGTQNSLSSRPDYDGHLTDQEAEDWYNNGGGLPLFVDASQIDFMSSELSTADFPENGVQAVNFFDGWDNHSDDDHIIYRPAENIDVGRVYGVMTLRLLNSQNGSVVPMPRGNGSFDTYDFSNPILQWKRTQSGGTPTSYNLFSYGRGRIHVQ